MRRTGEDDGRHRHGRFRRDPGVPGQDAETYVYNSIVDPNAYIVENYQAGLMPPRPGQDGWDLQHSWEMFDSPSALLDGQILRRKRPSRRRHAPCIVGGGGFEAVFPELSQMLAVNRTRELLDTGAEIIVTHCPGCIMQLKDGVRQLKVEGVEVLDLTEIIAAAMES